MEVGERDKTTVMDVIGEGSWAETAAGFRETSAISEDAFLVSDSQEAFVRAIYQTDFIANS